MGHGYRVPRRLTRQEKRAVIDQNEQVDDWWREVKWFTQRLHRA